jgi:hypothetical protein
MIRSKNGMENGMDFKSGINNRIKNGMPFQSLISSFVTYKFKQPYYEGHYRKTNF